MGLGFRVPAPEKGRYPSMAGASECRHRLRLRSSIDRALQAWMCRRVVWGLGITRLFFGFCRV